ncbi:hypothetical protein [Nostoc sp. NMS4]|nr:hypothetical protein [Nostoc sp. NMS4]MBN3926163.1 hypothetical protein [Nostoc sp. NMS4]
MLLTKRITLYAIAFAEYIQNLSSPMSTTGYAYLSSIPAKGLLRNL